MRFNLIFSTYNKVVELAKAPLLEVDLEREVLDVFHYVLHQGAKVLLYDVSGTFTWYFAVEEVYCQDH